MSVPELGYWKIRGLAEPIRYLFKYVGQEFKDTMYEQGDGPQFSRESWLSVKKDMKMNFPNLPYLKHGDLEISESWAIMKYITNKWAPELNGNTIQEKASIDELQGVLSDIKRNTTMPCYMQGSKSVVADAFMSQLEKISKFLGNKKFLSGDNVSIVDFFLFEIIENGQFFTDGKLYETYTNFQSYVNSFKELKGVKDHVKNSETYKLKFNNKIAQVNN